MIVFVDASFLIALFNEDDEFHKKAKRIIKKLEKPSLRFLTSNIVLAETVNLTFRRLGPKMAKKFFAVFKKSSIEEIFVEPGIFNKAYRLFFAQKSKRGLNFFDCLHLATMRSFKIKTILSFDKGFTKEVEVMGI